MTAVGLSFYTYDGLKIKSSPTGKPWVLAFDGDEGAIHAPQSLETQREVSSLMGVWCNIMSAQSNKNIAGVVYDSLVGIYLLTQPDTVLDVDDYNNIIGFLTNQDNVLTLDERAAKYYSVPRSGKVVFSALLPADFYYRKGDVVISEGILISGVIKKDHIGSSHGSIIQALYKDYGQDRTVDFLTDVYRVSGSFLDSHGFSVGLDDCFLTGDDPQKPIQYEIERARMMVKSMGMKLLDPLEEERRERQIIAYVNTAKEMGTRISEENLSPDNSFNVMAKSGAKGSAFNIAQITGILGQQFVGGQRMPTVISGKTRALPYFEENSLEPEARGFVVNSFLTGLTPAEMFFHFAGGREGLTDTAIRTADTGALHHKIAKALEDIKVVNDGSVRNGYGNIFQFSYGEDGFDASMLEGVRTKSDEFASFINLKRAAGRINANYGYSTPDVRVEKSLKLQVNDTVKTDIGEGKVVKIEGPGAFIEYPDGQTYWTEYSKIVRE